MELAELQKQIEALTEEINKIKNDSDSATKLTEADDESDEEVKEVEETEIESESEDKEEVETEEEKETEIAEIPVEEPSEDDEYNKKLIDSISGNLLRTFMDALNEINILKGEAHDEKFDVVFDEIADNTNKVIGSLQAVLGEGNADADAQEEAREEAEDKIEGEEPEIEEVEEKDELEVIKPLDDASIEDANEDDVEEVEETEEVKESLDESFGIKSVYSVREFEPWGPARRIWEYITDNLTWDEIEACLEAYFGEDAELEDVDLNDFIAYHQIGSNAISDEEFWEIFGLSDPDAEEEIEEVDESCNKKLTESLSDDDVIALRKEIMLGSLFTHDYENSFGIDPHVVQNFFDGYVDYLQEIADEKGIDDAFDLDDEDNLISWYYCFEEDPLPVEDEDDEDDEDFDESCENCDDNPDDDIDEAKTGKCHRR